MSRTTRAELADVEPIEPRCRICRDPDVRRLVNDLLGYRGFPVILGPGKTHQITYADILRQLEPVNEGRAKRDRITYDSLWVHAKRHYELAGIAAYCISRMDKELQNALGDKAVGPLSNSSSRVGPSTKNSLTRSNRL
jgi:hypothetical protein